jgi:G3E family GTPase
VTLVDATHFRASRALSSVIDAQVAYADVLLVTKSELAGPTETQAVLDAATALAPRSLVRVGSSSEHAAWVEELLADPDLEHVPAPHPDHEHHHEIESVSLLDIPAVDLEELEDQLAELPPNYVRIKGIVRAADGAMYVIHRVGPRVSSEPLAGGGAPRFVALGRELDPERLRLCIDAARVENIR